MPQQPLDGAHQPMHMLHGRACPMFFMIVVGLRIVNIVGTIVAGINFAMALSGISGDAPHTHAVGLMCCGSVCVVMVGSLAGFLNVGSEVRVTIWVMTLGQMAFSAAAFWTMNDSTTLRSIIVIIILLPPGVTVTIVLQSYIELCGTPTTPPSLRLLVWLVANLTALILSVRVDFTATGCVLVSCTLQLLFVLLAQGFAGQVKEWMRLSYELLGTVFDATFVMGCSDKLFVQASNDRLDKVFKTQMNGCILDDSIIINGVEAARALYNRALPAEAGASYDSGPVAARAFVTCRDAWDWEFEAELRTTPVLHGQSSSKHVLCGLIIFGEKRPPTEVAHEPLSNGSTPSLPTLAENPGSDQIGATLNVSDSVETMQVVDSSHPLDTDIRNVLKVCRKTSRSLPSVPEEKESTDNGSELSQQRSRGWQIDTMLGNIASLQQKFKQHQHHVKYKFCRQSRRFFCDSIDELVTQTEEQLLSLLPATSDAPVGPMPTDEPLEQMPAVLAASQLRLRSALKGSVCSDQQVTELHT